MTSYSDGIHVLAFSDDYAADYSDILALLQERERQRQRRLAREQDDEPGIDLAEDNEEEQP